VADPLIGHATPRLRFDALIGRGGMGAVYRGVQLGLGRPVAIKVVAAHRLADPRARERFRREARVLGQLVHPHVVACHMVGEEPGPGGEPLQVLVMELVEGETLGAQIAAGAPVAESLEWLRQAALGLAAVHRLGVVHRDVKPDNILVGRDGRARLGDFGLARGRGGEDPQVTLPGMLIGSPAYLAPEACRGEEPGPHADCYALGVSLWQAATGELPFAADNALRLVHLHTTQPPPRLAFRRPALAALEPLVQACLAKHPAERPDAAGIAVALADLIPRLAAAPAPVATSVPVATATVVDQPIPAPKPARRRPGRFLGAAAVLAAGAAVAAALWPRTAPAPAPPPPVESADGTFAARLAGRLDALEVEARSDPDRALLRLDALVVPPALDARRAMVETRILAALAEAWDRRHQVADQALAAGDRAAAAAALSGAPPARLAAVQRRHHDLLDRLAALRALAPARQVPPPDLDGDPCPDPPAMTPLGAHPPVQGRADAPDRLGLRLPPPEDGAQVALVLHPGGAPRRIAITRADGGLIAETLVPGGVWSRLTVEPAGARELLIDGEGGEPLVVAGAALAVGRAPDWAEVAAPGGLRPIASAGLAWTVRRMRRQDAGFPRWDRVRLLVPRSLPGDRRERLARAVARGTGAPPIVMDMTAERLSAADLDQQLRERAGVVLVWCPDGVPAPLAPGAVAAAGDLALRGCLVVPVIDSGGEPGWETALAEAARRAPGMPWLDVGPARAVVGDPDLAADLAVTAGTSELRRRLSAR
jgi:hypothetical protein